ncbi:aldolase/citrate lyase family protein [Methylobacterium sp. Leaf466]|uniref:aldolase/citrate lyase family protein n=1 Tax=Methylobacterium sp. Leaf466 TaxID=1736386 RepID=UPI0009E9E181|nr:aldolase/citrate lyase family protein [Methylobacterium sp. Leaf466]
MRAILLGDAGQDRFGPTGVDWPAGVDWLAPAPTQDGDGGAPIATGAAGLLLPVRDGRDVARLGVRLAVHEARAGLGDGSIRIVAMIADARGVLGLPSLVGAGPRLSGIAWDAQALCAEMGLPACRDAAGGLVAPLARIRGLVRIAAAAAGIAAIDTACPDDPELAGDVAAARAYGFAAKIAARPGQVAAITAPPQADA